MVEERISGKKLRFFLICGILGCLLMGGGDWLMIYGDTAYEGNLAWLTAGVAQIEPWRNSLALAMAFPAVIFYSIALFAVRYFLRTEGCRKIYSKLTVLGMLPWLCLHLFYIMILFLFGWMQHNGYIELSFEACEALFGQYVWLVPAAQVLMLLPFIYLFAVTLMGKTFLPRWMALNNPLIIYVVLKLLTGFMPDVPMRLAFVNGLMSECMAVWFLVLLTAGVGIWKRER